MAIETLLQQGDTLASLIPKIEKDVATNRAFVAGDHWQNATQWIGPPVPADMLNAAKTLDNIAKDFTPVPLIGDSVERHVQGVCGKEPAFHFTLKDAPEVVPDALQNDIDDLDALAGNWWDTRNGHEVIQDFTRELLQSNRATLRLFVPPDRLARDDSGATTLIAATMEDALDLIYVDVPEPDAGAVYLDRNSMQTLSLYQYRRDETDIISHETAPRDYLEITYLADNNQTVLRLLRAGEVIYEQSFDCDGELWMHEANRAPFITEPARRLQNAINLLNSMLPRNGKYAGNRGRHAIGLKQPAKKNPATGQDEKIPPSLGAGKFMLWNHAEYIDENRQIKTAPGSLVFEEPVDSGPIRADIEHLTLKLLETFNQSHILLSGDGASSAVALVQKRAAFAQSLLQTKPKVEGAARWLVKTVLALAAHLAGDTARLNLLKQLRVNANCKADSGPLSPDERRVIIEQYQGGLLDEETTMVLLGVEDIDAVVEKMKSDPFYLLKFDKECAEVLSTWTQILDMPDAMQLVPLREEVRVKLEKMMARMQPNGTQPNGTQDDDNPTGESTNSDPTGE